MALRLIQREKKMKQKHLRQGLVYHNDSIKSINGTAFHYIMTHIPFWIDTEHRAP